MQGRHWLGFRPSESGRSVVISDENVAQHWRDEGLLVEGPFIPSDDAAIERAANRSRLLCEPSEAEVLAALDQGDWAEYVAREILRAAGETP